MAVKLSLFKNKHDTVPQPIDNAWEHLVKRVRDPYIRAAKDGPLVSPGRYDPPLRANENVKEISALFLDLDHDVLPIEEVRARVCGLGECSYLIYSTHSHRRKTESNPQGERRLRVVIPLAPAVPAEKYSALRQYVLDCTDLPADKAASALAQMYYLPAKASVDAPYEYTAIDGVFLHWQELELSGVEKSAEARNNGGPTRQSNGVGAAIPKGQRNNTLLSLAGTMRRRGLSSDEIATTLRVVNGKRCQPPLPDGDVIRISQSIGRYKPAEEPQPDVDTRKRSQAAILVELAADAKLFHSEAGDGYASFMQGGHLETSPLRAKAFRQYLSYKFYNAEKKVPGTQAIQDAVNTLSGQAVFDGPCREVFTRVAQHEGVIYIDLANDQWQIVRINASGGTVIESRDCPVRFRRPKGMAPLPHPVSGGDLRQLRDFVNVTDEQWPLFAAYLAAALRPGQPCPVLGIHGPQGSAKSTTAEVTRALIDPNTVPLRSEPRDVRDLMIAANNSWVIALDNLSNISGWLSDALCRLSTGGGFGTRQLFTDEDEMLFDALRPVMFTGIVELADRSDLLDRAIVLNQPLIEESKRRPESTFWPEFEAARPAILGALYTAISCGLRQLPTIDSHGLSRMADFCVWGMAVESGLGLQPGEFMRAYRANRAEANDFAIEASPVASAIMDLMESTNHWDGYAKQLLVELEGKVTDEVRKQREWPKLAHFLAGKLKRIAPNLRAAGINIVIEPRTNKGSLIRLTVAAGDADDAQIRPDSDSGG